MQIVSDNAGDNQLIVIVGLDVNYNEVVELVALNGLTPVALSQNLTRINNALNISSTAFAGRVVVEDTGSTNEYCVLLAVDQRCSQAVYTVPANKRSKLEEVLITVNQSGGSRHVITSFYINGPTTTQIRGLRIGVTNDGNSAFQDGNIAIEAFPPKTDIEVTTVGSIAAMDVSHRMSYIEWID